MGGTSDDGTKHVTFRGRAPLRFLSLLVLAVLVAGSVALSLVVGSVIRDEQSRLLHERITEGGLLVGTLFNGVGTTLSVLGAATGPRPGSTDAFTTAAKPLLGEAQTIGALRDVGGTVSVLAAVGQGPAAGTVLAGTRATLAKRALTTHGMVSEVLDHQPGGSLLGFAVATGPDLVLFEDVPLAPFAAARSGSGSPFSELTGAVYASTHADPSALVLSTTTKLPLTGAVQSQPVTVGAESWLLVARSNGALVGPFSADAPWMVLAGGLLAALLATTLVETLGRRRAYALALVDQRTLQLRDALDEQARLEQGQRTARESAEAANRSKSEFLSRMSHELRTPLNAVLGFGQLLDLDDLDGPQQEAVDQIIKGGRHLLDLINEVLDISRIETGSLHLSPEPVHVAELVDDTLSLMRPLADARHIQISAPLERAGDLHVLADRQRLKQILLNLIANAIKYNRDQGTVTITAQALDEGRLRIDVTDTGMGIRSEDLQRLFVPFDRLDAERTSIEGTGVGLALSRGLAEAMGGTLEVSSTYGQGSRFSINLAVVEGQLEYYDRVSENVDAPDTDTAGPARHTVLYIEDNLSNIRLVERVLQRRNDVEVIPAMQGRLGLALAREHHPVLILLDLHLPDLNGDEVLHQLRTDPATADIPVVIVSADATSGQVERLLGEGATSYLTKPLDVQQLLDALDQAIDTTHATA